MYPYLVKGKNPGVFSPRFLLIALGGFCIVPYMFLNWVGSSQAATNSYQAEQTNQAGIATLVDTALMAQTQIIATMQTATPTATITPTITPSATGTPDLPVMEFQLSFYDPHIGAFFPEIAQVNCLIWDEGLNDCISLVNNGTEHYFIYYRKGVACPPPLRDGQRIRVIEPVELARINEVWTCIDRGGAIIDFYLDFMLRYPDDIWTGPNLDDFPWSSRVLVEVLP